mgnify:CR=1 FL=1
MTTKSLSQKYEKLSDLQHVLQNPDTYVGSVEKVESLTWVYDDNTNRIIRKNMEMIPAFYKIFDEPIVNSRDHVIRVRDSPDLDKKFNYFGMFFLEWINDLKITNIKMYG